MTTREHETQASGAEPPVIDLAAEEVGGDTGKPDEAKPETESVSSAAEQPSRRPPTKTIVAAVVAVLAVVAGALLYRNFGERVWPGDRILALEDRIASLDATAHTFSSQLAGLGAAVDRMRAAGAAAGAKIDDAAATAHDASERLKDLEGRMGEAEADLKRQQEALASLRPAAAGSTQSGGASSAQLAALTSTIQGTNPASWTA